MATASDITATPFAFSATASRLAADRARDAVQERGNQSLVAERELVRQLGRRYASCTLDNYQIDDRLAAVQQAAQKKVVADVTDYIENVQANVVAGRGLLLFGTVGTGKDHLMAACCLAACQADLVVVWKNASDIFTAGKATWGKRDAATIEDILKPLERCDVLALSDPIPPVGDIDHHEVRWLQSLIDRRYRDNRPTWITMNATDGNDARRALSSQVVDRLAHGALVCEMKWPSYRRVAG